jgi:DNA mismatch repair protein MutL
VPLIVELDSNNEKVDELVSELRRLGFEGKAHETSVEFTKIPSLLEGQEQLIQGFFRSFKGNVEDLERQLYARMSCRAAIMDGDPLEASMAMEIIDRVLVMENPRCPHGRPIWFELSREELFQFVGRT